MAEKTHVQWATSTWNPWIGCTRVGPGCDNCYAEAQDARKRWGGVTHWGPGVARRLTSVSNWGQPAAWDRKAKKTGIRPRVFCGSLCDVFDNEVPPEWRHALWKVVINTPNLQWLLVTKRIGNVEKMWPVMAESPPPNVRLLITVCNQEEADRDLPKLLALPCKNGISYEPALGPVDWRAVVMPDGDSLGLGLFNHGEGRGIEWLIVGGESGPKARPFDIAWARSTVSQCKAAEVPVFCKQLGGASHDGWDTGMSGEDDGPDSAPAWTGIKNPGANPDEWPADLRVRQFPDV